MTGMRSSSAPRFTLRRAIRGSIAASLAIHAVLLGVLISTKVVDYRNQQPVRTIDVLGGRDGKESVAPATSPVVAVSVPSATSDVADRKRVAERVSASIAESQNHSTTENLAKLDEMSGQLKHVSTPQSLAELTRDFRGWMGLQERAVAPVAEPAPAATPAAAPATAPAPTASKHEEPEPFDFQTAQFHEVERREGAPGSFEYTAVLVDAAGRTHSVRLSEEEGRPLYELLQRVRENPLLDQVYRQLAMPLLDQLISR